MVLAKKRVVKIRTTWLPLPFMFVKANKTKKV